MKHFSRAALIGGVSAIALMAGGSGNPAQAVTSGICPAFGADTDCGLVITLNPGGTFAVAAGPGAQGPYDGSDDTLIGIENLSGKTVNSIHLTSTLPIGGFEIDGIDSYGATKDPSNTDTTGYGGPLTFFTNNLITSLDANFTGGLADKATTFFSLEDKLNAQSFGGVPEPGTLALLGSGLLALGIARRRKKTRAIS